MLKTPPLRVSRPVSACSRCRAAKIRCDGKLPACTACERAGKANECSSGTDQFARGKERSYVASLETKIERLERQLHYRKHIAQPIINIQSRPYVSPAREPKASRAVEASHVDELVSDFGHLSVNATSNAYHGFDRDMSLARLLLSTALLTDLPSAGDHPLPPRPVAISLIHACVANFFTLCPVMSFTSILGALERVYDPTGRTASPQDIWNVRLCLAMGLSARSKAQGDPSSESAIRHVSVAVETVAESVIAPSSLARLRSLLLLVLFSTASPKYLNSWYLIGMASRFMAEMGLHAESSIIMDSRPSQTDQRRVLFLLVYGLDRFVSMSRLKPFSFSDDSVHTTMPFNLTPQDIMSNKDLARSVIVPHSDDDYAKTFGQIQQEQSLWYQSLFYSHPQAVHEPYHTRLGCIYENYLWLSKIPASIQGPLRSRFLVQILYGSVLLIVPLETSVKATSAYGKALALEYICSYATAVEGIAGKAEPLGTTKNEDFLRTRLVSSRLLQLVQDELGPVFVPATPSDIELQQGSPLPSLSWASQGNSIALVIETVRKLDSALAWLNAKYGHKDSYDSWKADSENALQLLYGHYSLPTTSW